MTTLKVGIAGYDEMKARTMRIAKGEEKPAADDPKVLFTSMESFAQLLSSGNRELLRVIDEQSPGSLEELAQLTGRATPNVSRTLKKMESFGLVRMEKGKGLKLVPKVVHDRVELVLPLPAAAVQQNGDGYFAWVVNADGNAEMRPLNVAGQISQQFQIASGVKPGERAITDGAQRVQPGAAVQILN